MKRAISIRAILLAAMTCLCVVLSSAQGALAADVSLEYKANGTGVSDETTKLTVSKLETDTHEAVEGAHLAIFTKSDYDSGNLSNPVTQWWTGTSAHEVSKTLDAGKTSADSQHYVLVELDTPDGYLTADPVEFYLINDPSATFTTKVVIDEASKTKQDGSPNCSETSETAWSLALYDEETAEHRELVQTRKRTSQDSDANGSQNAVQQALGRLAQTGDDFSLVPIVVLAVAGIAVIGFGIIAWRRSKHDEGGDKS